MHKLTVTLRQHTPLIHFQHDQEGATLRASEVKPKLDRFLLGTKNYSKIEDGLEKCLIGYTDELHNNGQMAIMYESGKCSLDYKLLIENVGEKQVITSLPSYFAEGGCGLLYPQVKLTFVSKHELVIEQIRQYVSDFFIINNFGNRTSKGYGGYMVERIEEEPFDLSFDDVEAVLTWYRPIVYKRNGLNNECLLSVINEDYQLLKSGKNCPYKKSILFGYAIDNQIRWEKRKIKRRIFQEEKYELQYNKEPVYGKKVDKSSWIDPTEDDFPGDEEKAFKYYFVRAMLGLPNHYEFLLTEQNTKLIVDVKRAKPVNQDNEKYDVKIDKKAYRFCDEIERFKSPIYFKIITIGNECRLYMVSEKKVMKSDSELSRKTFIFCMEHIKKGKAKYDIDKPFYERIVTPDSFDYENFLEYATNCNRNDNIPYLNYTKIVSND